MTCKKRNLRRGAAFKKLAAALVAFVCIAFHCCVQRIVAFLSAGVSLCQALLARFVCRGMSPMPCLQRLLSCNFPAASSSFLFLRELCRSWISVAPRKRSARYSFYLEID